MWNGQYNFIAFSGLNAKANANLYFKGAQSTFFVATSPFQVFL
jgi:hypothetical protein